MTRKLDVARTLEEVFDLYRRKAAVLLPVAALVFVLFDVVEALVLNGTVTYFTLILFSALGFIATLIYQGFVVEEVADMRAGGARSAGELMRAVQPALPALALAAILGGIAIAIGFALLIVPGIYLLTIWAVLTPVIVLERTRALDAFGRSRALVRGSAWQVLGVIVVVGVIQWLISFLAQSIGSGSFGGYLIALFVAQVLTAPVSGLAAAIMYFELLELRQGAVAPGAAGAGGPETVTATGIAPAETTGAAAAPYDAAEPPGAGGVGPASAAGAARTGDQPTPAAAAPLSAESTEAGESAASVPEHPADWYPDPRGEARLRYWDGAQWTDHTAE